MAMVHACEYAYAADAVYDSVRLNSMHGLSCNYNCNCNSSYAC